MELRQVRYFEAVARNLHFTRAAAELHVAQPALSAQIRRLESELGVQLFDRTSRSVHLTDAGIAFQQAGKKILADVAEAEERLRDLAEVRTGDVAVCVQQSLNAGGTLPPLLTQFRHEHPGINVSLTEESTPRGLAMLTEGDLDLGLLCVDEEPAHDSLVVEPFIDEELAFIAGAAFTCERKLRLEDLKDQPFIDFQRSAMLSKRLFGLCASRGFVPRIAARSDALGSVRALASAGLGIALLPLAAVEVPGPPVRVIPIRPNVKRTVSLVWPANRYQSAATRALVALLHNSLG